MNFWPGSRRSTTTTFKEAPKILFFTSDSHFGHSKMAAQRGFGEDTDAMDEALIKAWNSVVHFGDTVYHLGDLSFRSAVETAEILCRLRGTIHLVPGNHDKALVRQINKLQAGLPVGKLIVHERLHTLKVEYLYEYPEGVSQSVAYFELCHYPMLTWDRAHFGTFNLHGHSHGHCRYPQPDTTMLDVGVDSVGFEPIALPAVLERMKGKTFAACDLHDPARYKGRTAHYDES